MELEQQGPVNEEESREQGAGSREQGAGSREQGAGSRTGAGSYLAEGRGALSTAGVPEGALLVGLVLEEPEEVLGQEAGEPGVDLGVVEVVHGVHLAAAVVDLPLQFAETLVRQLELLLWLQ